MFFVKDVNDVGTDSCLKCDYDENFACPFSLDFENRRTKYVNFYLKIPTGSIIILT